MYINGIEVPCPEVSITYGVWSMPEASLSFPPHRALQRLGAEDRLEVTIFYLDDLISPANPEFRLLFEGEIVGWSYKNAYSGRVMQFNAIANMSIFTQLYFFFMSTSDNAVEYLSEAGSNPDFIASPGSGIAWPFSLFHNGLFTTNETVKRPYDLLYNAVRGLISSEVPEIVRSIPAVNFFNRWIRKTNFHQRFVALPLLEDGVGYTSIFPMFDAVKATPAVEALRDKLVASVGNSGSVWEVLQGLFAQAAFEIVMLPTAPCVRVDLSNGKIISPAAVPTNDKAKYPLRIANYFAKPQMYFGITPSCNVIFPPMIQSVTYTENFAQQPTRTYINDQFVAPMLGESPMKAAPLRVAYPPSANAALRLRVRGENAEPGGASLDTGKNMLVFPEEFYKGPVVSRSGVPPWFTLLQLQTRNKTEPTVDINGETKDIMTLLFELYVQYEHFRARYEKRGGAVDLVWNPYIVPGFPCTIFDKQSSNFDLVGYVMNVSQTMSVNGMGTAINFSFGRTLPEMMDVIAQDVERLGIVLGAGPADPVDAVRNVSQGFKEAEQFYGRLFHGEDISGTRSAAFDWRKAIEYVDEATGEREEIQLSGPGPGDVGVTFIGTAAQQTLTGEAAKTSNIPKVLNLDGSRSTAPTEAYHPYFENYDQAMQFVSRPICTLNEYIAFIHNETPMADLLRTGQVEMPEYKYNYSSAVTKNADLPLYYGRIRRMRQGPGGDPGATKKGAEEKPVAGGTTPTANPVPVAEAVEADFPQTRADWDTVLVGYRNEMYSRLTPQD